MARTNGASRANGNDAPLPSTLAARVVNGNAATDLNRDNFAQLIQESLGSDEYGQPNLGRDELVNFKLMIVILRLGIDPYLASPADDPFRPKVDQGRNVTELKHCLGVLKLAIERSPQVLYKTTDPVLDGTKESIPLYGWLIPELLSLVAISDDVDIKRGSSDVIVQALSTDTCCDAQTCGTILGFLRALLSALVNKALQRDNLTLTESINLTGSDFAYYFIRQSLLGEDVSRKLRLTTIDMLISTIVHTARLLLRHPQLNRQTSMQIKKLVFKLQNHTLDMPGAESLQTDVEGLKAQLQSLSLNTSETTLPNGSEQQQDWPDSGRPHKRLRLSNNADEKATENKIEHQLLSNVTGTLTGRAVPDLDSLAAVAAQQFKQLTESEQCEAISLLGRTSCQLAASSLEPVFCPVCDTGTGESQPIRDGAYVDELLRTLMALRPLYERRSSTRLAAADTYRRLISHTNTRHYIRLSDSTGGKLALQLLRSSSSRDARIVAARLLQAFVRNRSERDTSLVHENRIAALEYIKNLEENSPTSIHEAIIVALTRMAQVVGDAELNIILLRLVEYLGHPNPYVSSLATSEIQQLAQHLQTNVQALFRPFWRTISIVVVKNLISRPIIAQQLSELMGMEITGLLQIMEEHALPYLVLNGSIDIINKIAVSGSSPVSAFDLCVKSNNLPKIFALLLSQAFADPEESIMKTLMAISEDFSDQDLASWIHLSTISVACELLKAAGDVGQGKSSKIYQGLQALAALTLRKPINMSSSRRNDHTAVFLEANALAIITDFTVKLDETEIREPTVEKRRHLLAIGEFVKLSKSRIRKALPQICACLRSAMDDSALCNAAFTSWAVMITSLSQDDLINIVDQTLALIVRSWQSLDSRTREQAQDLVKDLLKNHKSVVSECFETMPSLDSIPEMSAFESEIRNLKVQLDERRQLESFVIRVEDENLAVVEQALQELVPLLRQKQVLLHRLILREQPDVVITSLMRSLLDCSVKFTSSNIVTLLSAQALGALGCLDYSKVEGTRVKPTMTVLSNFAMADETISFLLFFMQHVVVKEYVSTSSLRTKSFLGWALQELLKLCEFPEDITSRTKVGGLNPKEQLWFALPEEIRVVLTPFLRSKFSAPSRKRLSACKYPILKPGHTYQEWLTDITLDFLDRGPGQNVDLIFGVCNRMVYYGQGTAVSSFLLPYAALNLLLAGVEQDKKDLVTEILWVLNQPLNDPNLPKPDVLRQCSQSIFDILDYMSVWVQEKRKLYHALLLRAERGIRDPAIDTVGPQIQEVESVLKAIPPEEITQRSIECRSYARALFHWEEYIHSKKNPSDTDYRRLQDIYAQIDEPDGIEGISTRMHMLDAESQVLEHKKAGRWQAAQNWYEMQLAEQPRNVEVQVNLLSALKESGQYEVLLHHFDGISNANQGTESRLLPFAIESAWASKNWTKLSQYVSEAPRTDFTFGLGSVMLALNDGDDIRASTLIDDLFEKSTSEMTYNSTSSFHASHESMLKMHLLDDIRIMSSVDDENKKEILDLLDRRLNILGTNIADKQYLLGIQRAIMDLRNEVFSVDDVALSWLKTAKLARKSMATNQAFDAMLRASTMGEPSVAIEQAKLMWAEGHHRKAINTLEGAIESGALKAHAYTSDKASLTMTEHDEQNNMTAKAYVLLGKWLDQAGQTQSEVIIKTFRKSTEQNRKWEKGWYNLGRHYNKILESEKTKAPGKESQPFLTGEAAKIVIDNFLRALACGNRYLFQTLPKVLTLWLELVSNAELEQDARRGTVRFHEHNSAQRKKVITETNAYVKKYIDRLQPVALYTILPQLVARICQPNPTVHEILQAMVVKVIRSFPQQSLWTLMAVTKSSDKVRAQRGLSVMNKVVEVHKKDPKNFSASEMRTMITEAQKFTTELLRVADYHIEGRVPKVSLARDLGFNHKIAPSKLVVPAESCLIPNIPMSNDAATTKTFRPFSKDAVTVSAFLDEALVLSSLQKPRKMGIRGSDGNIYNILAKPKDDLRKDQRLMEFNTMINRFLKRDMDASKRQLYIRTYAVVPLNEECGVIEWVDNLKTMRDILLKLYRERNTPIDYASIRTKLDEICAKQTNRGTEFTERILSGFPPVLRYWFVEIFADPTAWLNARIRYTRSSAVMSIVGHMLGLGDRHGENILFEEDNGGILHVDFNCLFDKGLTFDKPECVPFRLTHNMIDAFGAYGYEGPFRRCCEITLTLLRNNEDGLMTILETFLHDPTTDFMTAGKRRKTARSEVDGFQVPDTAEKMLEGVKGKVRGMLAGESVPLSVGGYVEEMIKMAASRDNLARMYIGWCAFL